MNEIKNCRELFLGRKLIAYAKLNVGKDESYVLIFDNGQGLNESTGEPMGLDTLMEAWGETRKKYVSRAEKSQVRVSELDVLREQLIMLRKAIS